MISSSMKQTFLCTGNYFIKSTLVQQLKKYCMVPSYWHTWFIAYSTFHLLKLYGFSCWNLFDADISWEFLQLTALQDLPAGSLRGTVAACAISSMAARGRRRVAWWVDDLRALWCADVNSRIYRDAICVIRVYIYIYTHIFSYLIVCF